MFLVLVRLDLGDAGVSGRSFREVVRFSNKPSDAVGVEVHDEVPHSYLLSHSLTILMPKGNRKDQP